MTFEKPPIVYKEGEGCFKCLIFLGIFPFWFIYHGIPRIIYILLNNGIDVIFALIGEKLIAKQVIKIFKFFHRKTSYASYSKFNPPVYKGLVLIMVGFIYQALGIILSIIYQIKSY